MILRGENFRLLIFDSTLEKYKCVGMATNCAITQSTNTQEASSKDDVGMAAKPVVTSQGFQVQVDSLNVIDAAAVLTAIRHMAPFTLLWTETSTEDNQAPEDHVTFSREGQAYLSDATFNFNDRELASKNLTFSGTGPLQPAPSEPAYEPISAGSYTRGQYIRLFVSSDNTATPIAVIAAARTLSFHVSLTMEASSTKDTQGNWEVQTPTALAYDFSTSALTKGDDVITSQVGAKGLADLMTVKEACEPVKWEIANVTGANQRTKATTIVSGSAIIQTLTINNPNRRNSDYTVQFAGYGIYTVATT